MAVIETTPIPLNGVPADIRAIVGRESLAVQNTGTARVYWREGMEAPDPAEGGHILPACGWVTFSAVLGGDMPIWFWSTASGGGELMVSRAAALG